MGAPPTPCGVADKHFVDNKILKWQKMLEDGTDQAVTLQE